VFNWSKFSSHTTFPRFEPEVVPVVEVVVDADVEAVVDVDVDAEDVVDVDADVDAEDVVDVDADVDAEDVVDVDADVDGAELSPEGVADRARSPSVGCLDGAGRCRPVPAASDRRATEVPHVDVLSRVGVVDSGVAEPTVSADSFDKVKEKPAPGSTGSGRASDADCRTMVSPSTSPASTTSRLRAAPTSLPTDDGRCPESI
jgi:hypothetical protein